MSRVEKCTLTNMCMIQKGNQVLVQNRLNPNWPGIVFPGGHVEEAESLVDSVIREIKEETGLTLHSVTLCGVKQFYMADKQTRYLSFCIVVMIFLVSSNLQMRRGLLAKSR